MAFEFDPRRPASAEFRRVALEEVEAALAHLGKDDIHQTRRTLKQLRALLHLAKETRTLAHPARDAARLLSQTRDHAVCLATLERVSKKHDPAAQAAQKALGPVPPLPKGARAQAREMLESLRAALTAWEPEATWESAFQRLRKTYRRTRHSLEPAELGGDEEAFHELRKGFKRLWAQLRLLPSPHGKRRQAAIEACDGVADLLGDEHDYAVLQTRLAALGVEPPAGLAAQRLKTQEAALELALPFLARKPRATVAHWYGQAATR